MDGDVKGLHFFLECVIHYVWFSTLKLHRADPTDPHMVEVGVGLRFRALFGN